MIVELCTINLLSVCLLSDIHVTPLLLRWEPHNERILLVAKDNMPAIGPMQRFPGKWIDIYVTFTWCDPGRDEQTVCVWRMFAKRSDLFPF